MFVLKDDSLLVVVEGKRYKKTITKHNKDLITNCAKLCQELEKEKLGPNETRYVQIIEELTNLLSPANMIECKTDGRFIFDGENDLFLKGAEYEPIPKLLAQRILDYLEHGLDVNNLVNFWKNCLLNPDKKAVEGLFRFLEHNGHQITSNGYFFGYKKVQVDKRFDKKTGEVVQAWEYN